MAEYQRIEYQIGKDGKITERVIDASGNSCLQPTQALEKALGEIESRELLPEYYEGEEILTTDNIQRSNSVNN
jgi:TusA-related sulfurtransferase